MPTQSAFRAICNAELGKPYIWGASGPAAFDCSGVAQFLLEKLDLDPPGDQTAEGLYRTFRKPGRGTSVALAEAALGDLVFFGGDTAVTHVGLAWGGGDMIEAGGGGRATTTPAIARRQGAEVRIRPITRRKDRVAILRPAALAWTAETGHVALEALAAGFGRYEGTPLTEWLSDGRHMQLKRSYAYVAENGTGWPVPSEAIVDGASIPPPFWSVIGGPFEGLYRDASIVHDYYCDVKTRAWRDTHRMFYEAMRCSGVGAVKAKVMYYAVYRFGPKWALAADAMLELPAALEAVATPAAAPLASDSFDPDSAQADVRTIVATDPDLAGIEALADTRAATRGSA